MVKEKTENTEALKMGNIEADVPEIFKHRRDWALSIMRQCLKITGRDRFKSRNSARSMPEYSGLNAVVQRIRRENRHPEMMQRLASADKQVPGDRPDEIPHSVFYSGAGNIDRSMRKYSGLNAIVQRIRTESRQPEIMQRSASADNQVPGGRPYDEAEKKTRLPSDDFHDAVQASYYHIPGMHLRQFLSNLLHIRLPAVRLYTHSAADAVARKYRADALTLGDNILFRSDRYNPKDPKSIALLGHELTHAAQQRGIQQKSGESGTEAIRHNEQQAMANEARVLQYLTMNESPEPEAFARLSGQVSFPLTGIPAPLSPIRRESPPGHLPSPQPMAASGSRNTELPVMQGNAGSTLSESQLRRIKEEVYKDLMDRIRTEFERGA